ncbi:hypothetical protein DU002_15810 [Corallincola holothuriorum]|uniref:Uncharacterized protein n=1 Tax=Corallincola holothuriorum TaxID=2282215 RepID=A0A368N7K7_9GAMM|nr:hypothetical protein [Corallincola holothuriorum]RCU45514.1 hypothetical protein DU002_15810 [Corallincola holothuriorum]
MKPSYLLVIFCCFGGKAFAEPASVFAEDEVRQLCQEWADSQQIPTVDQTEYLMDCMAQELEARGYFEEDNFDEPMTTALDEESDDPYSDSYTN